MASRPLNVLWLVSDHQIHNDPFSDSDLFPLQIYLTERGTCFTHARTALPICSPARASMLTGLYPHAHGLTENDGRFGGRAGLNSNDWLVSHSFQDAGYRCAWFGKWHLNNRLDATDFGYEGFSLPGYGYPYATARYRDYLRRRGLAKPVVTIELSGESGIPVGTDVSLCDEQNWFDFESGSACIKTEVEGHESYFLADLATQWIEANRDEPFFLRVDPWGPHPPYCVAAPFDGMAKYSAMELPNNFAHRLETRPAHHRDYRDYWSGLLNYEKDDWRLLRTRALQHCAQVETALLSVVKSLDRLDLAAQTLVVFTADHGDAVGSNGGVANKGGLLTEETVSIPLLISGPGVLPKQTNASLVSNVDLAPTLLEVCGLDVPSNMHGKSLLSIVSGAGSSVRQGLMAQHYGLHQNVVQRAWYQESWKYVVQSEGFEELYDLPVDPGEMINLALEKGSETTLKAMRGQLRCEMVRCNDLEENILSRLTE
ncbi:MAG: sulfatase-like hydrolase/transferase [Pseudomonadota bacterium]